MSGPIRVLIVTNGARNPFLEAWVATIAASGASVAVLLDARRMKDTFVPDVVARITVVATTDGGEWKARIEALLGGEPQITFDYWGMQTLLNTIGTDTWPAVRRVVSVDTFPNASRRRAEVRDLVQANVLLNRADGLSMASRTMSDAVRRATLGRSSALPTSVIHAPFPASAHADGTAERAAGRTPALCFTGRSDYLFSADPRMAKDAVGPYLQRFIEQGAEMHVLQPDDTGIAEALQRRGFHFYPSVSRTAMTDGGFARMISRFDGHLVTYAQSSPVIRRRVEASLSTRFATAVCAPTPIITPTAAIFSAEFFDRFPIGFRADEPEEILARLQSDGPGMAEVWRRRHTEWAGEAYGPEFAEQWAAVLRRRPVTTG